MAEVGMKTKFALIVLTLAAMGWAPMAMAAGTTVTGPIYTPNTVAPFTGSIVIVPSQQWVNADGVVVAQVPITVTITAGNFTVSLEPNETSVPSGTYYTFTFFPSGQRSYALKYAVPTSASPVTIAGLSLLTTPPTALYSYVAATRAVNASAPLIGGGTLATDRTISCPTCVHTGTTYTDPGWLAVSKAFVGLGAVENTALSTWTGSANLASLGTVNSGTWHGTPIADAYIASAATWNVFTAPQAGNKVVASPSDGSSGAPVARTLVAADIPSLGASKIASGQLASARGGLGADASGFAGFVKMTGGVATATLDPTFNSETIAGVGPGIYEYGDENGLLSAAGGFTTAWQGATGRSTSLVLQMPTSDPSTNFRVPIWGTPVLGVAPFSGWANVAVRTGANAYSGTGLQDFAGVPSRPFQSGAIASIPSTCLVAQKYYATDTAADYTCTNTNTWAVNGTPATGIGLVSRVSTTATAARTITGTAGAISVTNGDGVSGNPVIDIASVFNIAARTSTAPIKSVLTANMPATCNAAIDFLNVMDAGSTKRLYTCNALGTGWALAGDGDGAGGLTTIGAVPFVSSAGTLGQDSLFSWDSGNRRLGIGTAAPSKRLHIADSVASTTVVQIDNTSGTSTSGKFEVGNGYYSIGTVTAHPFVFVTTNAEAGRFNATGLFGLGITNPTYKLHVAPSANVTPGQTAFIQDATATTGVTTVTVKAGAGQSTSNLVEIRNNAGALLSAITSTGTLTGTTTPTSTDTFTNKTFDTAGAGNSLSINGTAVTAVTGTGSVVLATGPTFTGTVNSGLYTFTAGSDIDSTGTNVTIAPTKMIQRVTGTGSIQTITPPASLASTSACIYLIPTAAWTMTTGGNISRAVTAAAGRVLTMCYMSGTSTWYPSY